MVVVGCLAAQVVGVWWGTRNDFVDVEALTEEEEIGEAQAE